MVGIGPEDLIVFGEVLGDVLDPDLTHLRGQFMMGRAPTLRVVRGADTSFWIPRRVVPSVVATLITAWLAPKVLEGAVAVVLVPVPLIAPIVLEGTMGTTLVLGPLGIPIVEVMKIAATLILTAAQGVAPVPAIGGIGVVTLVRRRPATQVAHMLSRIVPFIRGLFGNGFVVFRLIVRIIPASATSVTAVIPAMSAFLGHEGRCQRQNQGDRQNPLLFHALTSITSIVRFLHIYDVLIHGKVTGAAPRGSPDPILRHPNPIKKRLFESMSGIRSRTYYLYAKQKALIPERRTRAWTLLRLTVCLGPTLREPQGPVIVFLGRASPPPKDRPG
jgi:hypothetical protein